MAHRVGRGIALLFHDRGTRRGEWSATRPGRTLPPGKTGTHFRGNWVGLRDGLDGWKISSPPGFDIRAMCVYITSQLTNYMVQSRPEKLTDLQLFNKFPPLYLGLHLEEKLRWKTHIKAKHC